jgi:hypothetical protein
MVPLRCQYNFGEHRQIAYRGGLEGYVGSHDGLLMVESMWRKVLARISMECSRVEQGGGSQRTVETSILQLLLLENTLDISRTTVLIPIRQETTPFRKERRNVSKHQYASFGLA